MIKIFTVLSRINKKTVEPAWKRKTCKSCNNACSMKNTKKACKEYIPFKK